MMVSIMSACCRVSVQLFYLFICFLHVLSQGEVFQAPQGHSVFLRAKRANMFLLEELLQGNLERECYEELCNFEEAREYFEDHEKTVSFWTIYYDGDQCEPNPCLHGGNCTDKVGGFHCSCTPPHFGSVCEYGGQGGRWPPSSPQTTKPELVECPTEGPTACHQLCTASYYSFTCSCMSGFKLHTDKRSCLPQVDFPCGQLPDKFNTTTTMCRHGNCPWQVTLVDRWGVELCGGVVLGRRSVLTAARCLHPDASYTFHPSNFFVRPGNMMLVPVRTLYINNRFRTDHYDNDLVLVALADPLPFGPNLIHLCLPTKDFSENVLMHSGRTGVIERQRGSKRNQDLVYMTLDECRQEMNVSHPLSNKMFCTRRQNRATGRQNGTQRSPNRHPGHQTEAQGKPSGPPVNRNEPHRRPNVPSRHHHGIQRADGPLGTQNGAHRRLDGHINSSHNQSQRSHSGALGTPNGADHLNSSSSKIDNETPSAPDSGLRSEVSGSRCSRQLPGSPIATVEQGTVFLTGLLLSQTAGCDGGRGLVFTKLSRYLTWIRPRLEASEDRMTSQVSQYPESR